MAQLTNNELYRNASGDVHTNFDEVAKTEEIRDALIWRIPGGAGADMAAIAAVKESFDETGEAGEADETENVEDTTDTVETPVETEAPSEVVEEETTEPEETEPEETIEPENSTIEVVEGE